MFVPTYQLQDETDSAAVCGRWPEREGGLRQKTSTCTYVFMARHTITHHVKNGVDVVAASTCVTALAAL